MKPTPPGLPDQWTPSPVPPEQRPLQEYRQLCRSWFFAWPCREGASLGRALALAWSLSLPACLLVASGSLPLRHDPARMVVVAFLAATGLPMLLLVRQWLGWTYVLRRLMAETVEYEESGWYDGQIWEKPLIWRQQDLLVATHQVAPVLARLRRAAIGLLALLLIGTGLCQAL